MHYILFKCYPDRSFSLQEKPFNVMLCLSVDGGWSVYGPYGSCSRSCGGGVKTHSRTCTNPEPAFGGKECQGPSTESTSCNTNPCKSKLVEYIECVLLLVFNFKMI